jgi:hypothetical protein
MTNQIYRTIRYSGLILGVTIIMILTACMNPFIPGLGKRVDITAPIVTLDTPSPGSFLRGLATFVGTASDDIKVESVQVSFNRGSSWSKAYLDPSSGQWSYDLDTTTLSDGNISLMVRATDNTNKKQPLRNCCSQSTTPRRKSFLPFLESTRTPTTNLTHRRSVRTARYLERLPICTR